MTRVPAPPAPDAIDRTGASLTRVFVPSQLRGYTAGATEVTASGATLAAVLADLDRQFPGIRFRVIDEQDRVRQHILLFVAGERQEDLSAPIPAGAEVYILGALSGGWL